jgi:uncharacterized membrane protein
MATKEGPKHGLSEADRLALVDAIREAERDHVGEIRVHLEERCPGGDALARAKKLFGQLGMHRTQHETGVLLYVATEHRRAAVFADRGIHGATSPAIWQEVVAHVADGYRKGKPAEGLIAAVAQIGAVLREHAAGHDHHGDELPNALSES